MLHRKFVLILSILSMASMWSIPAVAQQHFKVGFAKKDITPQVSMPMWGYGARHADESTGIRDPLYAKAVVIDIGADKLAIVGLDLGRSPMDETMGDIREAVDEQAGVNYVMMSGSHTHHGPVLELKDEEGKGKGVFDEGVVYIESLDEMLIDVIVEAADSVEDAQIGWGAQMIDMNRNRHTDYEPKPRDRELNVIRFDNPDGAPIALVVNYAAHPTMLPVDDLRYSAEYPGQMMKFAEGDLDTNVVFMQGAAGDMSVKTTAETKTIETYGRALADHVIEIAGSIETSVPEELSIDGVDQDFELPTRIDFTNAMVQGLFKQAFFPELAMGALDELLDNTITPHLTTVLMNGNLALVGGSGEFFCNHAIRLKERSRVKTIFFGYCNGHHMYFPTIEAAAEGGYGGDPTVSWVPIGTGERMMNRALTNIYQMRDRYNNPMERKTEFGTFLGAAK